MAIQSADQPARIHIHKFFKHYSNHKLTNQTLVLLRAEIQENPGTYILYTLVLLPSKENTTDEATLVPVLVKHESLEIKLDHFKESQHYTWVSRWRRGKQWGKGSYDTIILDNSQYSKNNSSHNKSWHPHLWNSISLIFWKIWEEFLVLTFLQEFLHPVLSPVCTTIRQDRVAPVIGDLFPVNCLLMLEQLNALMSLSMNTLLNTDLLYKVLYFLT